MEDSCPLRILVRCQPQAVAERLKEMLSHHDWQVECEPLENPDSHRSPFGPVAGQAFDLLVTNAPARDGPLAGERRTKPGHFTVGMPDDGAGERGGGWGIVGWGTVPGADVELPLDASARELELACRLVAQVARLRTQRDALKQTHAEALLLAETDPLTGLANRRVWEARLLATLAIQVRGEPRVWLVLVDLDEFKQINDRLGMSQADAVLADAARALGQAVRRHDLVARLGGDEFGILLSGVSPQQVAAVVERLRGAVEQSGPVTASMGYAAANANLNAEQLLTRAERAMRTAKREGGNQVVRYDPPEHGSASAGIQQDAE